MKRVVLSFSKSLLLLFVIATSSNLKAQILPGVGNIVNNATELILPDSIDGIKFFRVDHLEVNELSFLKGQMVLGEGLTVTGDGNFASNLIVHGRGIFSNGIETGLLLVDTLIATQDISAENNLSIGNDGIINNNLTVQGVTTLNDDFYAFPVNVNLSNADLENTGIALIDENGKFIRTSLASVLREVVNGDPCTGALSTLEPNARWSYSGDNITTSQCKPDAKVGIRTSQPREALEVRGNLFLSKPAEQLGVENFNAIYFSDESNYLKSTSSSGIQLTTDGGSNGVWIQEDGKVGIGTSNPKSLLDVAWSGSFGTDQQYVKLGTDGANAFINTTCPNGNLLLNFQDNCDVSIGTNDPQYLEPGETPSNLNVAGSGKFGNTLRVGDQTFHSGDEGFANLELGDEFHGVKTERGEGVTVHTWQGVDLFLKENGSGIGVGTKSPLATLHVVSKNDSDDLLLVESSTGTEAFKVKGGSNPKVFTQEINVKIGPFPDYVFNSDYKLLPLEELDEYIQVNEKLPGMPSASQVEELGVDLGEMNRLLVEKVEELTLYLIEQQQQILLLQQQIVEMRKK